jgi:hypothetical protein
LNRLQSVAQHGREMMRPSVLIGHNTLLGALDVPDELVAFLD